LENNGYKFELYIMDAYLLCDGDKFGVVEVLREEEFAPVKNAIGSLEDSPDTARSLISKLHQRWLRTRGAQFTKEASGIPEECCEISPLVTYDIDDLDLTLFKDIFVEKVIELPFYLPEI